MRKEYTTVVIRHEQGRVQDFGVKRERRAESAFNSIELMSIQSPEQELPSSHVSKFVHIGL